MAVLKTTSPRSFDGRTKTTALEDRAVFQGEDCWVQLGRLPPGFGGNFYLTTARRNFLQSRPEDSKNTLFSRGRAPMEVTVGFTEGIGRQALSLREEMGLRLKQ